MKNTLVIALSCLAALAACSKAKPDPAEDAFRKKFDEVCIGMVQDEVVGKLGQPNRILVQTEEEDDQSLPRAEPSRSTKETRLPFGNTFSVGGIMPVVHGPKYEH